MPNMNIGFSSRKLTASLHSIGANTWPKEISCFAAKLFRRVGEDCCTSGF